MNLAVEITDADVDRIARRVAEFIAASPVSSRWLDVAGAAAHLAMSDNAVRALVKRQAIPCHRTPSGRVRFDPGELDAWARTDQA